jgi:hypothetical protein
VTYVLIQLTDLCGDIKLKLVGVMLVTAKYKILRFI